MSEGYRYQNKMLLGKTDKNNTRFQRNHHSDGRAPASRQDKETKHNTTAEAHITGSALDVQRPRQRARFAGATNGPCQSLCARDAIGCQRHERKPPRAKVDVVSERVLDHNQWPHQLQELRAHTPAAEDALQNSVAYQIALNWRIHAKSHVYN
jgi:hypothetical protein